MSGNVVGFFAAMVLAGCLGGVVVQSHYRSAAVEHGCAAYDPQTGGWGWKP